MFWKEKQNNSEIFSFESNDRRSSYRVLPPANAPIVFKCGGEKVQMVNISAGGLAFKNKGFKSGDTQTIELLLPYQNVTLAPILEINTIDDQNVCHCRFREIGEDEVEAIHKYVLKRQKEVMQSQKASKNVTS
ncbi:MAG: PilZ domain-containing protein [Desulfobacterales bacterium]|uniref:PilZ domain-containing protein n=1 Tax=Candidatus Desulfatibia vada TaxID=2841696 RepID=A0A8J6P5C8_9BACT|nr:PilZ domain-containing protein [Candidatus Desulfatibia vada]MBL6970581.1 PilZ domain-containing protein [Desulfobacterales bacterium]